MLMNTLDSMRRLLGAARGNPASRFGATSLPGEAANDLIYRMKAWPQLPEAGRTAEIYRMLSVMSSRPVNRQWMLARSRMRATELDSLLQGLVDEGAIEVIDPARFAGRDALQA
jgi:hypothetical protein